MIKNIWENSCCIYLFCSEWMDGWMDFGEALHRFHHIQPFKKYEIKMLNSLISKGTAFPV